MRGADAPRTLDPLLAQGNGGVALEVSSVYLSYAGSSGPSSGEPARGTLALSDVSFSVRPGEFLVILGPSGCGKSTLLKVIAGLLKPSRGEIRIGDAEDGPGRVGFVFQSDALLPWRTAVQNVQLAVELAGRHKGDARNRAVQLMEELGLGGSGDKYLHQLSGGMRKRVALARTFAYEPSVFLMDEPFGSLDAQTRILVGNFFLNTLRRAGQTVLFVTHDVDEAIALADRIVILSKSPGRVATIIDDNLPKPRDYYQSRHVTGFNDLQKRIWEVISA